MKFSELSDEQRTTCFRLLGVIQGRLEYVELVDRHAVDVMLLEIQNELSASRLSVDLTGVEFRSISPDEQALLVAAEIQDLLAATHRPSLWRRLLTRKGSAE